MNLVRLIKMCLNKTYSKVRIGKHLYRTIWLLLDSVHRLVCGSFTKNHNVSETGLVSVLRWMGQGRPTQLGPSERASLNHAVVFFKTSTYQTMDRVQKKPNSSVTYTIVRILSSLYYNMFRPYDAFLRYIYDSLNCYIVL
jgi:hypothetical protein